MPSLFGPETHPNMLRRIEALRPDSPRQWGKMTAAQMQVHIGDQMRIALGELHIPPKSSPLGWRPVRWLVIHSPMPWPKGAPTAPQLMNPSTAEWDADRARLLNTFHRVVAAGETNAWHPHPAFGKLSGHSWGVLMWRHLDHHLRQFSV